MSLVEPRLVESVTLNDKILLSDVLFSMYFQYSIRSYHYNIKYISGRINVS